MTTKKPQNRNALDHVKEGLKNIPKTYNTLYNREMSGAKTAAENVRVIVKGNTAAGMPPIAPDKRVKLAAMGAASVTPLGPVAAFAAGVAKSVEKKATAKAAAAAPKVAPAPVAAPKLKIKAQAAAPAPAAKPGVKPTTAPSAGVKIGARGPAPVAGKAPGAAKPAPGAAAKPGLKKT